MCNRRVVLIALWSLAALLHAPPGIAGKPGQIAFEVLQTLPHDRSAYTQGLVFADGQLYEGTGRYGRSVLRLVDFATGTVRQQTALAPHLFGEGVTVFGERLVQLTWKSGKGFVYHRGSLDLIGEFSYPGQGWGLTSDRYRLIMSDGSARLRFLDPVSFVQLGDVLVFDDNGPIVGLNELEYVDGFVYANVYRTSRIVKIDPRSGAVVGWLDISKLTRRAQLAVGAEVANGIAYDVASGHFLLTGKQWPYLYVVKLFDQEMPRQ